MIDINNFKLIKHLIGVFNGNNSVFMADIASKDLVYKSSIGGALDLIGISALQENLTYHVNCKLAKIESEDNILHDVRVDLEIHDPITKLHQTIPTLAKVKIEKHLISRIEISFIASVDDFEKLKQFRQRIELLSIPK